LSQLNSIFLYFLSSFCSAFSFQYPPELYLSSSTLLMEATVQSPLRLLVPRSQSSSANTSSSSSSSSLDSCHHSPAKLRPPPGTASVPPLNKRYSSSRGRHSRASRRLFESKPDNELSAPAAKESSKCTHMSLNSTQHRLDSILSKYHVPGDKDKHSRPAARLRTTSDQEEVLRKSRGRKSDQKGLERPPKKITFKSPVSRARRMWWYFFLLLHFLSICKCKSNVSISILLFVLNSFYIEFNFKL